MKGFKYQMILKVLLSKYKGNEETEFASVILILLLRL